MFTGIIKSKSKVLSTSDRLGIKKVSIEKKDTDIFSLGASISVSGVCSTVVETSESSFSVEYMPETLSKTTMKNIVAETVVNIEESLRAGDPIDGHFVYGHVDAIGIIEKIKHDGESKVYSISLLKDIQKYIVYKGSVAIDGVSLTISAVAKNNFEVSLIPYTLEHTTLGEKKVGDIVNIETDILARYVQKTKD